MEKVLIVEDEKMVADVISNFFKRKGLKVDIAYDLSSGMEKFSPEYDMVLLDIALGEERSFPLLKKIKEDCPDMPVLMFSGYDSDENIRKAKRLGYSLNEIKHILEESQKGESPCPMVRDLISRRIQVNRARLEQLMKLQVRMEQALKKWATMPDGIPNGHSVCQLIEFFDSNQESGTTM